MSITVRWIIAAVAAVLVLCLLGWARGVEHHRGNEVGSSLGTVATVVTGA
jgi:hypothetical protein